jgi:hypothetical protein
MQNSIIKWNWGNVTLFLWINKKVQCCFLHHLTKEICFFAAVVVEKEADEEELESI